MNTCKNPASVYELQQRFSATFLTNMFRLSQSVLVEKIQSIFANLNISKYYSDGPIYTLSWPISGNPQRSGIFAYNKYTYKALAPNFTRAIAR